MALRSLVPPADSDGRGQDTEWKVDIVAVHGLNPRGKSIADHAKNTWTKPENEHGFLWLRDELPKTCPHARVFYYEYNSNLVFGQTREPFIHKANEFLDSLRSKRKANPARPLILIAHSLGGVLIEQALVNAHNNEEYAPIKRATIGLMFFGTPHGGGNSKLVAIGSLVAGIATKLGFSQKSDIALTLKGGSIFSDILQESFRHQLETYQIISWYEKIGSVRPIETLESLKQAESIQIVPMHSANFGLPGTRERILGIDADHSGMCRFDPSKQQDRDNLEKVMSGVEDLYNLAVKKAEEAQESSLSEFRTAKRKVLKWLYRSEHEDDYEADLYRHQATHNTCNWLHDRPEYKFWVSQPSASLLWVNGIPGSGKSFLSAHAIRSLQETGHQVFYFFCNNDYVDTRLATNILGCLLYQLLTSNDQFMDVISPYHDKSTQKRLANLDTASQIFKNVLSITGPCYIIIDAIDECVDRVSLIQLLCEIISNVSKGVKILAVSRDEADIRRCMTKIQNSKVEELQIRDIDVSNDIERVIDELVSRSYELSSKLADYPSLKRDVVSGLVKAARGMFLLPKFMIIDLEAKAEVEEIYECLNDIPMDLNSYYISTMSRMDVRRRPVAKKVFTWVLRTKRPLSLEEIRAAMSLDGSRYLNLLSDIRSSCGCFIRVENNQVRLSHNTVKQFLLESKIFRDHPIRPHYFDEEGGEKIADVTSQYMFRHKFRVPLTQTPRFQPVDADEIRKTYPFLEYAAMHWMEHCRESKTPIRFFADISHFLDSNHFSLWYEAANIFNVHEGFSMHFDQLQQWFLSLGLPTFRNPSEEANIIVTTANKISQIWNFIEKWQISLRVFPSEIHNLDHYINPQRQSSNPKQQLLQTEIVVSEDTERQIYNLVDGNFAGWRIDRFLIGATSIFSWNSLMQSEAWDVALNNDNGISPDEPSQIQLRIQNLYSRCMEGRYGLVSAGIDRLNAHAVLRPDLGALAIVWACFDPDRTTSLTVKSYAWEIRPDPVCIMLKKIEWTDNVDPCRVDISISSAFAGSRAAVAFQEGGSLWTPGGAYEMKSGSIEERPPELFSDPQISQLSFCRNARMIAGVRNGIGLEIYSMPRKSLPEDSLDYDSSGLPQCSLMASVEGNIEILGMSPFGGYCLYIQKSSATRPADPQNNADPNDANPEEDVRIINVFENAHHTIWRPETKLKQTRKPEENLTLHHFYNNGGLFAFSESETILVLCVPTRPVWNIVAYDLQENDIASTAWTIDCADILMGMNPICLSFCPFNDRRLYILNDFGVIRAGDISRKDTASSASILTTRSRRGAISRARISGVHSTSTKCDLVVLEIQNQSMRGYCWDLQAMQKMNALRAVSLPWIRCLTRLDIDSLTVDLDGMLDLGFQSSGSRWGYERELDILAVLRKRMERNRLIIIREFGSPDSAKYAREKLETKSINSEVNDTNIPLQEEPGKMGVDVDGRRTLSTATDIGPGDLNDGDEKTTSTFEIAFASEQVAFSEADIEEDGMKGSPPLPQLSLIEEARSNKKDTSEWEHTATNTQHIKHQSSSQTSTNAKGIDANGQQFKHEDQKPEKEDDDELGSRPSDGAIKNTYSVHAKCAPRGVAFILSLIKSSGTRFKDPNATNLTLILSIIRSDTCQSWATGRVALASIGTPTSEYMSIEYDLVHMVVAYSVSFLYHHRLEDGRLWKIGFLYVCQLRPPALVSPSKLSDENLLSRQLNISILLTSMIFSPCGRYIYGTSSCEYPTVEIVDTLKAEITDTFISPKSRLLKVPQESFRNATNFSISYWRGHIMLVGNHFTVIHAARIHVAERASFSVATLAIAPSTLENTTGFKVLWPEDTSGEGFITIISKSDNQVLKDGEIGGNAGSPVVIKVKEKDIGAWSEPIFEPER